MSSAFQDQSTLFFVLEYCAGGELFFHISRLKYPVASRNARSAAVKMTTQEELAELAESNRDALGAGLGRTIPHLFDTQLKHMPIS